MKTPSVTSMSDQWAAHSSPRRAPVVMANHTNAPQSGSFQASFTSRAASAADGGFGFGRGTAGFLAWAA
jgi:hypothetical protein